jgi:hypothetical protein
MKNATRCASHNSISHGIFAKILLTGPAFAEEREDLEKLFSDVVVSIRPTDWLEQALSENLAVMLLQLTRVHKAEQAIMPKLFARVIDELGSVPPPPTLHLISKEDQFAVERRNPSFDSIVRYKTSILRNMSRNLDQIQKLRLLREGDGTARAQKLEGDHAKSIVH